MSSTFDQQFRDDIPDTSKISGIYIDRAKSNYRKPSTYVVAFNISGSGTKSYRVPVTEAMLVAKSRIDNFDEVSVVISGRASPTIRRNKTIVNIFGLKTDFQRSNSNGVLEYQSHNTTRALGQHVRI